MDTAVFWIEYIARNQGKVYMKPPTVDLPFYEYFLLDVFFVITLILILILYTLKKILSLTISVWKHTQKKKMD